MVTPDNEKQWCSISPKFDIDQYLNRKGYDPQTGKFNRCPHCGQLINKEATTQRM